MVGGVSIEGGEVTSETGVACAKSREGMMSVAVGMILLRSRSRLW